MADQITCCSATFDRPANGQSAQCPDCHSIYAEVPKVPFTYSMLDEVNAAAFTGAGDVSYSRAAGRVLADNLPDIHNATAGAITWIGSAQSIIRQLLDEIAELHAAPVVPRPTVTCPGCRPSAYRTPAADCEDCQTTGGCKCNEGNR